MFGRRIRIRPGVPDFRIRATCVRCLQEKDLEGMDRLLWCEECREAARRRAGIWGWGVGAVLALGLALWIWLFIKPSDLVIGGWIATVVAALLGWGPGWAGRSLSVSFASTTGKAAEAVPPGPGD